MNRKRLSFLIIVFFIFTAIRFPCAADDSYKIHLDVTHNTCYVRQELTAVLEIKSDLNIDEFSVSKFEIKVPGIFLQEPLSPEREENRLIIRRKLLPLVSGTFVIGPATVHVSSDAIETIDSPVTAVLVSNEVEIRVLTLPLKKGAKAPDVPVGEYDFVVEPDRTKAIIGEKITLTYMISGEGPIRGFQLPALESSPDFTAGPIKIHDIENGINYKRSMSYSQDIFLLNPVITEIPGLSFTYYSTGTGSYITRDTGPFSVKISGVSTVITTGGTIAWSERNQTMRSGEGMHGIRHTAGFIRSETVHTLFTPVFWYIQAIPVLAIILSAVYVSWRTRRETPELQKFVKAYRRARKELKNTRRLLKSGVNVECYLLLPKILRTYIGNKTGIPSAGMTDAETVECVRQYTVRKRVLRQIETLLLMINVSRYSKEEPDVKKVRKWLRTTERIIHWLEWHRVFRHAERRYRKAINAGVSTA